MKNDKVFVLKNTKRGFVLDTSYLSEDTLFIDFKGKSIIEVPNKRLEVNTYSEKTNLEIVGIYAAIFGGIAALIGAFLAFRELFRKDTDNKKQIKELKDQTFQLIRQNELFEKRIKMAVRPLIWSNTSAILKSKKEFEVSIENKGQLAFIDSIKFLDGDKVNLINWNNHTITLERETGSIMITGSYGDLDPKTMNFRFIISYHDSENFHYETLFEWKNSVAKIIETREL